MLYATPTLTSALRRELDELDDLRHRLGASVGGGGPWLGALRRQVRAAAAHSSISIEGFHVPEGEAAAVVAGEEPVPQDDEDRMALACYAHAMEHVGVMASDPAFRWVDRVVLDLHFDACSFQRDKSPGVWRIDPVGVTSPDGTGGLAYEGPDADDVADLMGEVVSWLETADRDAHVVVRAAMAHLHVVSVHPFRDGNGRISRIVQSLVLARDGLVAPEFGSIEEYLGLRTQAYYAVLQDVQGGRYQPARDATPWVAFCVTAHLEQARRRLAQLAEAAARWSVLEDIVEQRGWPDRLVVALEQSLFEGADRTAYATEADVSTATASGDLRRLVDAGLVVQRGKTRSTRYLASGELRRQLREALTVAPRQR